jgi:nucleoid-associated protein YgaU
MVNTASNYSESLNNYVQNNDYITQYVAKDGDNLRMVSQKFYGDSSYWSYLADINFLQNSGLTSGTVVLIPKIPGSTILQYPPPLNSIAVPATVT